MAEVTYVFRPGCWRYVALENLMEGMSEEQVREWGWQDKPTSTEMAKLVWSMELCLMLHAPAHTSDHMTMTSAFQPSYWCYVTLGDVVTDMIEEQVRELGWLNKPENTVLAKIIWSMEACRMLHSSSHTDDQSLPEGQADMAPDGDDQGEEGYSEHSA